MRWIGRSLMALVVLALLAVGALFLIPAERIAGLVVGQFNTLTGRQLVIEGAIRPTIWPVLGVKTGKVSISNADWSDQGPMFQAEALEIAVDLGSLFGGQARINAVTAVGPVLVLERAKDGRENWIFGGESGGTVSAATPGVGSDFALDKALISNGRVMFLDHKTGTQIDLTALDLETAIADFDGPVRVQMSAQKAGEPFTLDLTLGAFRDFLF